MKLEFIGRNGNTPDNESKLLAEFLIRNTKFLGVALGLLEVRKQPVKPSLVEDLLVKTSFRYDEIKMNDNYDEFVELMSKVYDGDRGTIDNRRGYILELLCNSIGTINNKEYTEKIENGQVYYNGECTSTRDIDIIYFEINYDESSYNFVELQECKACISHKVEDPVSISDKEKLELMKKTGELSNKENIDCGLYIITYDFSSKKTKSRLEEMGLDMIDIITRREIEEYIINN